MTKRFDYADTLAFQLKACGLPLPVREYKPFDDRAFRLDCAWPDRHLFVECDGGEFLRAIARRHGGATDCLRWNLLTLAGWRGFRFVGSQVKSGYALEILTTVLTEHPDGQETQSGRVSVHQTRPARTHVRHAARPGRAASRRPH